MAMVNTTTKSGDDTTTPFTHHIELLAIKQPESLLATPTIQSLLHKLKILVNAPDTIYHALYDQCLLNYVDFIQSLPSYKNKTYNQAGGLLALAIERTYAAMANYRKQHPIKSIKPENMPAKLALYTYALFTAGLFYNAGYVATNFWISVCDSKGHDSKQWQPLKENMGNLGTHFRYSYLSTNYDALAGRYSLLFAKHLMPVDGLTWIASDIEVMDYWTATLEGDERGGGLFAKQTLLAEEQLELQDEAILHILGIPLREEYYQLGKEEKQSTSDFFDKETAENHDKQQEKPPIMEKDKARHFYQSSVAITERDVTGGYTYELGEKFIAWLRNGIEGATIKVNRKDSLAHVVQGGLLLINPEIFKAFLKANPHIKSNWQQVASDFEKLNISIGAVNRLQQYTTAQATERKFALSQDAGRAAPMGVVVDPTPFLKQIPTISPEHPGPVLTQANYPQVQAVTGATSAPPTPPVTPHSK